MSDEKDMAADNPLYSEQSQRVIDKHLHAIMDELEASGVKPLGIVAGVLHAGETSVNWCVAEDVPVTTEEVAREIAVNIEASTRAGG